MADNSLEVKITADVTSLQAKSAIAKAELTEINAAVKSLAGQFVGASDEMKASLAPQLDAAAKLAAATRMELAALNAEMRKPPEGEVTFFGRLMEGMEGTTQRVEGLTEKFQTFSKLTTAVSEFVMAGLAVEKVADAFKEVAELGEQLNQLSMKTGISVSALSGLRVVAIQTGTDLTTFTAGTDRLARSMQQAVSTPTSVAAAAFREMGVSVTDASGNLRPMQDVLEQVSKKLADYQDGTAKTALVMDVFGRSGSTLIPMLNELGEQGFDGATEKAKQLGVAMDQTSAAADEQFNSSIKTSGLVLEGLRDTVVQAVIPGLTVLEHAFTTTSQGSSTLNAAEVTLADTFKGGIEVFTAVVTGIGEITDMAVLLGRELGDVATISVAVMEALSGNFGTAERMMKIASTSMVTDWQTAFKKMSDAEKTFDDTHNALWNHGGDNKPDSDGGTMAGLGSHQGVGKEQAPVIDKAALDAGKVKTAKKVADQEVQIAQDAANAQRQIQQSLYSAQVSEWNAEVSQGKMTKAQEIQDEIAAQQQIYQTNLAEKEKEANLAHLSAAQKEKALDDVKVYEAEHVAEMARLEAELVQQQQEDAKKIADAQKQAADKTKQAWQLAFQPITQAFDTSINGILQGTQTLQSAEAKAAQSITLAFIDAAAKKVVTALEADTQILAHGVATELGLTAATQAGEAERLSAKVAGDAQGRAVSLSTAIAQMNKYAATAAGGAFSAVAGVPIIGPILAPAAAAAAYTGVMAYEVMSAEGGTVIPAGVNPLMQLHEKEVVLPAHIAQPLLGMVNNGMDDQGGGDSYQLNFHNTVHSAGGNGGVSVEDVFAAMNAGVRSGLHSSGKYPALARAFRRG
ncbi:phage tail tape measure protein [Acidocella facilis]|uniref:phage tail tape measure protein n=1 Tax=Acidocella facilis TaxID=525 RepID=UPI00047952DE|nr:phage tail tape measure protein [Acidocella facilis]